MTENDKPGKIRFRYASTSVQVDLIQAANNNS